LELAGNIAITMQVNMNVNKRASNVARLTKLELERGVLAIDLAFLDSSFHVKLESILERSIHI
jgi:hypothetical protein